jgi:hypothetical protein
LEGALRNHASTDLIRRLTCSGVPVNHDLYLPFD